MTMPSRDFLIRQAILNATLVYEPEKFQKYGLCVLLWMTSGDYVRTTFCNVIRAEYRKLVEREETYAYAQL